MNRSNLPLGALRAFEAAARHLSFTAAADELCVTHGAVSQQIKRLEARLGIALFERHNRGVRLTAAGQTLLPVLVDSFDRIAGTLGGLVAAPDRRTLKVTTTPFFAARRLVPRLTAWRSRHDEVAIHLLPSLRFLDLAKGEADVAIRCGRPPWPGLAAELLLPIHLAPLCSPSLLGGRSGLNEPRELLDFDLIHADIDGHRPGEEWQTWLAAAGVTERPERPGLSFHDPGLALQAAADGLGVAIGYLELVEAELAAGRLVRPFELAVRHDFSYYLVYQVSRAEEPEIRAFRSWIESEA